MEFFVWYIERHALFYDKLNGWRKRKVLKRCNLAATGKNKGSDRDTLGHSKVFNTAPKCFIKWRYATLEWIESQRF